MVGVRPKGAELANWPDKKGYRQLAMATTIPIMLLAAPAVGYAIGYFLDKWLGTSNLMTVIFLLLGLVAGGVESYKIIKRISEEDKE